MVKIVASVVAVVLRDPFDRVLLQLRDGNTTVAPHRWCFPGGSLDPGEAPRDGALRELLEETGLRPSGDLTLLWHGTGPSGRHPGSLAEYHVYLGHTAAAQHEVQCNEGAAMVFTPIADLPGIDWAQTYGPLLAAVLPQLLPRRAEEGLTRG